MTTATRRPAARRPGFTLAELLVAIAIMATLAALSVGALFRIRTAQQKSATEATLQKLDSKVQEKIRRISEKVRDPRFHQTTQYTTAMSLCGDNPDIAQAILIYAMTRNELPMTFAEAKSPTVVGALTLPASPIFAALPAGTGAPEESAVCLHLALSTLGNEGLENQIGTAPSNPALKCYVDAYDQPIYFNRLAFGGASGTELNNPPYVKAPTGTNTYDPFYPKQTNGTYRNLSTDWGAANANVLWQAVVPPNTTYTAANNWAGIPGINAAAPPYVYPGQVNHTATVISAGADKDLLGAGLFAGDNIVGYRLRKEGQKGD